jgi:hypothetical protein
MMVILLILTINVNKQIPILDLLFSKYLPVVYALILGLDLWVSVFYLSKVIEA